MGTTFDEYFAGMLTTTVLWEKRNGLDTNGNKAYNTGISLTGLNSLVVQQQGTTPGQDEIGSVVQPTAEFWLGPDAPITRLDRVTIPDEPTTPFIVVKVERYTGVFQKLTMEYQTKPGSGA